MGFLKRLPLQQLAGAAVLGLVVTSLAVLAPALAGRLWPPTIPAPLPTIEATAPPAAVLLKEETDRDLQGVMIIANERTFGTAFLVDPRGVFLTAASLVTGDQPLRLVDNTGGSHVVNVLGTDPALGIAAVRAEAAGVPLLFGTSASLKAGDSLVILASAKVLNVRSATPAVVARAGALSLDIRADDLPGEIGGPLVGPGGSVLGVLTAHGSALPIAAAQSDLASWRGRSGTPAPFAGLPPDLVLRGTDDTTAPTAGGSLVSISPARGSTAQTTVVTLQGNGFIAGRFLSVRFLPVASPTGSFVGGNATFVNASAITVKVPAGALVQDYVVELINGDGVTASGHAAFTITP